MSSRGSGHLEKRLLVSDVVARPFDRATFRQHRSYYFFFV